MTLRHVSAWLMVLLGCTTLSFGASHVDATMLANVSTIKPGEPFEIGIDLKMSPGWHTYWSNPGDAGLATSVKWTLPPGFIAAPLEFPVPTQFNEPGGITVYGYENEVMLIAKITPPTDLKIDQPVTLTGKVSWLCCAEVCIPGSANLNVSLNVADQDPPANGDLFKNWRSHLPTPSSASATTLRLSDDPPKAEIFVPRNLSKETQFIPSAADGLVIEIGSPAPATRDGINGTIVPITGRVLKGQTVNADELTVLITHREPTDSAPVGEAVKVPITK